MDKFQATTKTTAKVDSVEDMRKFIDDYPQFQHLSGNVSKHVAMVPRAWGLASSVHSPCAPRS